MTLISDFSLQHLLSDVMQCTLTKLTGDTRLGWGRQMSSESLGCHSQWLEEQSSRSFMKFSGDKGEAHSPWGRYRLGTAGQVSSSVGKVLGLRCTARCACASSAQAAGLQPVYQ